MNFFAGLETKSDFSIFHVAIAEVAAGAPSAIRLETENISDWPTDLAISVVPYEDSWNVEIMRDGPQRDADRCDMIEAIADRSRAASTT